MPDSNRCTDSTISTGATRVDVYAHMARRITTERLNAMVDQEIMSETQPLREIPPVRYVHIDHSEKGSQAVLERSCPPEQAALLSKTRWGICNLWKPLKTVHRDPVAVCDARSVLDSDLAITMARLPEPKDNHEPNGTGKGSVYVDEKKFQGGVYPLCEIRANPNHKWYFASRMTPDECLLIRIYDSSKKPGRAIRAPHTAIIDPRDPVEQTSPRESVEFRCLLFWENEAPEQLNGTS